MANLTIGTRGSRLALKQASWVAERLGRVGHAATLRVIRTTGDRVGAIPLAALGERQGIKGVFTKEIEDALIAGEIDLAVHSLKDLPTQLDRRLALGCVPQRADPRDALLGRSLAELRAGDRVGTGSPRRAAQLACLKPGLHVLEIRGNVDTRIRKLKEGKYDAIVLAAAGLDRLGLRAEIAECLEVDAMVPAIGQGALGIEVRSGDDAVLEALAPLHHAVTAAQVTAERSLLRAMGGGCGVPLGAHAASSGDRLCLIAAAAGPGGGMLRAQGAAGATQARKLGIRVAAKLRRLGLGPGPEPA